MLDSRLKPPVREKLFENLCNTVLTVASLFSPETPDYSALVKHVESKGYRKGGLKFDGVKISYIAGKIKDGVELTAEEAIFWEQHIIKCTKGGRNSHAAPRRVHSMRFSLFFLAYASYFLYHNRLPQPRERAELAMAKHALESLLEKNPEMTKRRWALMKAEEKVSIAEDALRAKLDKLHRNAVRRGNHIHLSLPN